MLSPTLYSIKQIRQVSVLGIPHPWWGVDCSSCGSIPLVCCVDGILVKIVAVLWADDSSLRDSSFDSVSLVVPSIGVLHLAIPTSKSLWEVVVVVAICTDDDGRALIFCSR